MQYAELLCKTNFSFLLGASHPTELVEAAAQKGLSALAITDLDGMYGVARAHLAAKEHPALKLVIGAEITFVGHPRVAFLAANRKAYGLLCRMLTEAHRDAPKGEGRLAWEQFTRFAEDGASSGLVVLPRAGANYAVLKELFGDRLYLPLARHLDGQDRQRTQEMLEVSRRYGVQIVATNDVHYHAPERRVLQDVLAATRERMPIEQMGLRLFSNAERYLKSPQEMAALFSDLPSALATTLVVAERCTFSLNELRYRYPSEWIPQGHTAQSYLEELAWAGALKRYNVVHRQVVPQEVRAQLHHELALIAELGFADYFLTIWEIVDFARARQILCQGRGSAANSVVCYCLEITAIDPVRMKLLFERFISRERGEPPDIDVDFEHERREEVIQHIYEKYGRHRAAMVAAVITYRRRSALRDVRRALGPEAPEQLVVKLTEELMGFPRHLSIHSGGFTLSADPIVETVPVEPARMEGRTIVQWDKNDLDALGLLKVDVLALGMLTAIRKCCASLNLTLATIPAEDRATYEMMHRADTVGVFQIESRAQMNMLGRLQPETFYDLVVEVAIVRPGPIQGGMVHPYLRRKRGLEPPTVPDPRLEPILSRTLGVPLFQEQVMKIAVVMAGFTPGESDELRRAIGAWRSNGSLEKMGRRLIAGLLASGLPNAYVERLFKQIQGFAEYGFPESHAASFALLAYASSYLKCHHPAEFTCALLNSQPMGFYSSHSLVEDAKRHGVRVLSIDPEHSAWDCALEEGGLRLGLRLVNGLGRAHAEVLLAERSRRPFVSLQDFLARAPLRREVLYNMALADMFTCFGLSGRQALWQVLEWKGMLAPDPTGQLSLFAGLQDPQAPAFTSLTALESITADHVAYRVSARGHPMPLLRRKFPQIPQITTRVARESRHDTALAIAGLMIVRQRPATASGMVFGTIEDEEGFLDLVFFRKVYERYRELLDSEAFFVVSGILQRDRGSTSFVVRRMWPVIPADADGMETYEKLSHSWH